MSDDCLFCRIVQGTIPVTPLAENQTCLAFKDVNPQAPVHVLVVPRVHVTSLNNATDAELLGSLLLMAAEVAAKEGVSESGYRTVINTNADGGQSVFHIHAHVLGGRRLKWPPG